LQGVFYNINTNTPSTQICYRRKFKFARIKCMAKGTSYQPPTPPRSTAFNEER